MNFLNESSDIDNSMFVFEANTMLLEESDDESGVANAAKKLIMSIKELITEIIKALKSGFTKLANSISVYRATKHNQKELEMIKKSLSSSDAKVETYDFIKIDNLFKDYCKKMRHALKKISDINIKPGEKMGIQFKKAKAMVYDCKKIDAKYRSKIEEAKKEKKPCKAKEMYDWLEKNIDSYGAPSGPFGETIKTLEEYLDKMNALEEKYIASCKEKGYEPYPKEVSEYMANFSKYVHLNSSWISTAAMATMELIASTAIKAAHVNKIDNRLRNNYTYKDLSDKDRKKLVKREYNDLATSGDPTDLLISKANGVMKGNSIGRFYAANKKRKAYNASDTI